MPQTQLGTSDVAGLLHSLSVNELALLMGRSSPGLAQMIAGFLRRLGIPMPATGGFLARPEWSMLVRAGLAFACGDSQAAVAANPSNVQLFNPSGSGVRALIVLIHGRSASAGAANLFVLSDAAQITNLSPNNPVNLNDPTAFPTAKCQLRIGNDAIGASSMMHRALWPTATRFEWPQAPLGGGFCAELVPGRGIRVHQSLLNADLDINYIWAEVPSTPGAYP